MSKTNKKNIIKNKSIVVFTDGSCLANGKKNAVGGIGIHFPNRELKDVSKVFKNNYCTNQRAELYAILCALRYIKQNIGLKNVDVCIKTDSQYSIDCITKWVYGWIKNGWKTRGNTPVANKEFIEIIHKYYEHFNIEFEHVDAHTGRKDKDSIANAKADELATMASSKALKKRDEDSYTSDIDEQSYKKSPAKPAPRRNTRSNARGNTRGNYGSKTSRPNVQPRRAPVRARNSGYHVNGFPKGTDFIVELVKAK